MASRPGHRPHPCLRRTNFLGSYQRIKRCPYEVTGASRTEGKGFDMEKIEATEVTEVTEVTFEEIEALEQTEAPAFGVACGGGCWGVVCWR